MSGERYYTTKIWPQPSSTGSSNEDASFISTDPRGEPVTSTWKKSCREVETVPEFPELTCQNFRNPQQSKRSSICSRKMSQRPPLKWSRFETLALLTFPRIIWNSLSIRTGLPVAFQTATTSTCGASSDLLNETGLIKSKTTLLGFSFLGVVAAEKRMALTLGHLSR